VCRAPAGACDIAETCDGSSTQCPPDVLKPASAVCRIAAGQCDVAEVCSGSSPVCPDDARAPDGTACSLPNALANCEGGQCTTNTCDPGWDECNADPSDGCETSTLSASACGQCGNACTFGGGEPFCQNRVCACTLDECATCNDQHLAISAVPDDKYTFIGYGLVPGDTIILQALTHQDANNPFVCNLTSDSWQTLKTVTTDTQPTFANGNQQLFKWTATVRIGGGFDDGGVFPGGGLSRVRVVTQSPGADPVNAAAFEDDVCVSDHASEPFPSIISRCAAASIVRSCPGFGYQIVGLVHQTALTTDLITPAPFCPLQLGHYLYGRLQNEEPNLEPGCDYVTESQNYYNQIDPPDPTTHQRSRDTLAKWKLANNYTLAADVNAIYYNTGDLGVGRDMHCWKTQPSSNPDAAACYVTNYGPAFGDAPVSVGTALTQVIERSPAKVAATVAMEYVPGARDEVRFFVFNTIGDLDAAVQLDNEGRKPVPGNCLACHGGKYNLAEHMVGGDDPKSRANFLPFDPCAFTFSTQHPYTLSDQEETYRRLNQIVRDTRPESRDGAGIKALIDGMYGHAGGSVDTPQQTIDQRFVPTAWQNAGLSQLYLDVVKPYCRTCHTSRVVRPDTLDPTNNPSFTLLNDGGLNNVCSDTVPSERHFMPHAERTAQRFWLSTARAELVAALNDGLLGSAAAGMSVLGVATGCLP
jgi:mono/diheme cytochrome c family protein